MGKNYDFYLQKISADTSTKRNKKHLMHSTQQPPDIWQKSLQPGLHKTNKNSHKGHDILFHLSLWQYQKHYFSEPK